MKGYNRINQCLILQSGSPGDVVFNRFVFILEYGLANLTRLKFPRELFHITLPINPSFAQLLEV